jgi:SAM-dependent methyltransferase
MSPYRKWYNEWIKKNAKGKVLDVGKSTTWDYGFSTIDTNKDLKPDFIGSIEQTDFKDKEFDLVLCNGMYEHVSDPQAMINECLRIGKKVLFGFVGKGYEPYKNNWKYYDNSNFKHDYRKDFGDKYHFFLCSTISK